MKTDKAITVHIYFKNIFSFFISDDPVTSSDGARQEL